MTIIAPSLLAADFLNLSSEIKSFSAEKNLWLHLDIMDGHFVPNLTFGRPVLKNIQDISSHKLDAHFMVTNPADYIESFKGISIHNFTFHWEAVTHHDKLISQIKDSYPSCGISVNPSTSISSIPNYIFQKIDLVLLMSVNPGFGGQSFIEDVFNKIEALSKIKNDLNLSFEIQIDGGITDKNAARLIKAGATNLVAGSYIFKEEQSNYSKQIKNLRG